MKIKEMMDNAGFVAEIGDVVVSKCLPGSLGGVRSCVKYVVNERVAVQYDDLVVLYLLLRQSTFGGELGDKLLQVRNGDVVKYSPEMEKAE